MTSFNAPHHRVDQPLRERTIVVTRAALQAADFIRELEDYGGRVIAFPTIEIVPPESYQPLDEAIANLAVYDWIIFTSVNGVDGFVARLEAAELSTSELDDLRVCAVGAQTANRLGDAQVHVDVVPDDYKAEGVYAALEQYFQGAERLRGLRFLMPQAAVARDLLPRSLAAAGAAVSVVPAYRTIRARASAAERGRLAAMLVGGSIDCVTFTSSSTLINFAQIFETTNLRQLLDGVVVACIGDTTARTAAADYHLFVCVQPAEHTTHALARAIADYYSNFN